MSTFKPVKLSKQYEYVTFSFVWRYIDVVEQGVTFFGLPSIIAS